MPHQQSLRPVLSAALSGTLQMEANASRPEGLPPNQGGKYVGFGSGGSAPPRPVSGPGLDQVTGALASGWTQLSSAAGAAAVKGGRHWYT